MKKPSVLTFLISLIFSAVVCTKSETVLDTAGNALTTGGQYFIQPVKTESNNGGGLVPAAITVLPFCPLGITQTLLPNKPGLPVGFSLPDFPIITIDTTIKTTSVVNIEFKSDIWPVCNDFSKLWEVDDSSTTSKEPAILIGGKWDGINSRFVIEKAGQGLGANAYKLTSFDKTVGAIPGAWLSAPQLVLTNDTSKTLLVKFKKVDDAIATTASM